MNQSLRTIGISFVAGVLFGWVIATIVITQFLPLQWLTASSIFVTLLLDKIHSWQDFFGSLIAASVAILIFLLTERYKSVKEREDHLHLLHRSIGAALQNLAEIDKTIDNFAQTRIPQMIKKIDDDIKNNNPIVCFAFVPLLHVFDITEELLKRFSGSGYVDMLTIELVNKSKDLRKIIDDINRQFETSLAMNNQITLSRVNQNPSQQNLSFKASIEDFKSQLLEKEFRSNVKDYASLLIKTRIAVGKIKEKGGLKWWKKTFKHLKQDSISIMEGVDKHFATEIRTKKEEYQSEFRTPLLP